ncbi:MAG TPA: hypothetical protein VFP68_11315 [Burkholderiaceae bacterium]|nr:hypothetical protein [Burkholderiaceae bacterium]
MPDAPFSSIQPLFRLMQSNMSLIAEFWLSPEVWLQPLSFAQRAVTQGPAKASSPPPSDAFSRLLKGLMENYFRFVTEATHSGANLWGQAEQTAQQAARRVEAAAA